jgi:hypothetical protein
LTYPIRINSPIKDSQPSQSTTALKDAAAPKPPSALTLYNLVKGDWTIGIEEFEWHTELNLPFWKRKPIRFKKRGSKELVTYCQPGVSWSAQHCIPLEPYIQTRAASRVTTRQNSRAPSPGASNQAKKEEEEEDPTLIITSLSNTPPGSPLIPGSLTLSTPAPVIMTTVVNQGPSITTPTPFNGDQTKTNRFLHKRGLYILGKSKEFETGTPPVANDELKIAFVLSYMKDGTASAWAEHYTARPAHGTANLVAETKT